MDLAVKVLGSTAVNRLAAAYSEHVLIVGRDKLTRQDLAAVGCYNFTAARNLTAAAKALDVKNLQHLFDTVPPQDLAMPHVGVITLAVLGAAFEAKRIGGDSPLTTYVRQHAPKLVTFSAFKHQAQAELDRSKSKGRKRR